jgi:hypothetical protein
VSNRILIELDEALAWARGERRMQVRLPDGTSAEMSVIEYRSAYQTQERLRPHRGKPDGAARMPRGQA